MDAAKSLCSLLLLAALLSVPARAEAAAGTQASALSHPDGLRGIWITQLPETGTVRLGTRQIRPGDVLTAQQLRRLCFSCTGPETEARVRGFPVTRAGPDIRTETVFSIRGRPDAPPEAEDLEIETYRDLPREALLHARDPEGQALTFRLIRPPKRGSVILRPDGSFLYFPAKRLVGTDSFVYTASDPAGNCSREASVTVRIRTPSPDLPYADTAGSPCAFYAEWLRTSGIFTGESIGGLPCFSPQAPVSRGQFLTMLMQVLKLPADRSPGEALPPETPLWLRPYLTAALRSGILRPMHPEEIRACLAPMDSLEADRLIRRALEIALPASAGFPAAPAAAEVRTLTREEAARMLYEISQLNDKKILIFSLFRR